MRPGAREPHPGSKPNRVLHPTDQPVRARLLISSQPTYSLSCPEQTWA